MEACPDGPINAESSVLTELTLPFHTYELRSKPASPARLVNCYAEMLPVGAKSPIKLTRAPGITSWTTVGSGPIQGMHAAFSLLYVVSGDELYSVDSAKTATLLGNVGNPNVIDIASNKESIVVVNDPLAYHWTDPTFAQITDADFTSRGAGNVEFLDNYMLFREPGSDRIFGSDLGSVISYDALQFLNVDGHPDDLNSIKADHRQLICAGSKSMEIVQNTGVSGFPFERAINGYIEQGCANGKTLIQVDQSVCWVADDFTVRRLQGLTPVRISTHAVEQWLSSIIISGLEAFTYAQDGHIFYVLISPTMSAFLYDSSNGEWHERQTYGTNTWDTKFNAIAFDLNLVGSATSNAIGFLDPEAYDEFGSIQRMEWTYQPVYAEGQRAFHDRLEIIMETGVGLTTGQGSAPEIMLDYSDDGGRTWESMPNRSIGALGNYETRVVWHNLGSSRQRVYRAAISDPVKVVVTNTLLEVRGGRL